MKRGREERISSRSTHGENQGEVGGKEEDRAEGGWIRTTFDFCSR